MRTARAGLGVLAALLATGCGSRGAVHLTAVPPPPPVGRPLAVVPVYELLAAAPTASPAPTRSSGTQVVPSLDGQSVSALSTTPSARLQVLDAAVRGNGGRWRIELQTVDNPDMFIATKTGHQLEIVVDGKATAIGTIEDEAGRTVGYFTGFGSDRAAAVRAAHRWTTSVVVTRT